MSHPDTQHDPENVREDDDIRFHEEVSRFHPAWEEYWKAMEADMKAQRKFWKKWSEL